MSNLTQLFQQNSELISIEGVVVEHLDLDWYNVQAGKKIIRLKSAVGDLSIGSVVIITKTDIGYHVVGIEELRDITIQEVFIRG